tara:strand:+ start:376 stop:528 length:153 start_codon:yes stop_codon:yes gene_type:complete
MSLEKRNLQEKFWHRCLLGKKIVGPKSSGQKAEESFARATYFVQRKTKEI